MRKRYILEVNAEYSKELQKNIELPFIAERMKIENVEKLTS